MERCAICEKITSELNITAIDSFGTIALACDDCYERRQAEDYLEDIHDVRE